MGGVGWGFRSAGGKLLLFTRYSKPWGWRMPLSSLKPRKRQGSKRFDMPCLVSQPWQNQHHFTPFHSDKIWRTLTSINKFLDFHFFAAVKREPRTPPREKTKWKINMFFSFHLYFFHLSPVQIRYMGSCGM